MFFDDFGRAFANLRAATRTGGQLRAIAWRSPAENPFMTTAERAAAPVLPKLPPRRPDGPGQFALADRDRVQGILEASGWQEIALQKLDRTCTFAAQDLLRYMTRLGPLGLFLQDADDHTRSQVVETVRAAFTPYVHGEEVHFNAACWLLTARAP
jgi:hypothetical protein